jgi:hypothetical protein
MTEKEYPWTILHYNEDMNVLDDYDARTFPTFIVIDDDGLIVKYPAPRPSENVERLLMGL